MKLSRQKFNELLKENKLVLSLVGISNIGKTFWSKKLARFNFKHFSCDDLIEEKLAPELKKLGYSGIADVSHWMGQPYHRRFQKNQEKYLTIENKVMKVFLMNLKDIKKYNVVIDTTGSVVHCGSSLLRELRRRTLIVYIEATSTMKEEMFKRYIKDPKPVVFGNIFMPKKGETKEQTLERCYRKLFTKRALLYNKCADVIIPYEVVREASVKSFISLIRQSL